MVCFPLHQSRGAGRNICDVIVVVSRRGLDCELTDSYDFFRLCSHKLGVVDVSRQRHATGRLKVKSMNDSEAPVLNESFWLEMLCVRLEICGVRML